MHPWLFRIDLPGLGTVAAPSWFTWVLIGSLLGSAVAVREARRSGDSPRQVLLLCVLGVVSGLVGSRLGHVIFEAPETYAADPLKLLRIQEGGMVLYGGVLLASVLVSLRARRAGLALERVGDIAAPGLALGIAFGRLGCLSAGCCYGRPADWGLGFDVPWAVTFVDGFVPRALMGVPLHPTQAYASVGALALFGLLGWLRRRQRFDGQVLGTFLLVYGLWRPVLEAFRLDLDRGFVLEAWLGQRLSTSQAISIPVAVAGAACLAWWARRARREGRYGLGPAESLRVRRARELSAASD